MHHALALLALVLCSCAPLDTPAHRIAMRNGTPGKRVLNSCESFAVAKAAEFRHAGIPASIVHIYFRYDPVRKVQLPGHSVVSYQDSGHTYWMDNQLFTPKLLDSGKTLTDKATWFVAMCGGNPFDVLTAN